MTRPTILFAHAGLPAALRALYEAAVPGWRIEPVLSPFPGMSTAYTALGQDLRRRHPGAPLLTALLRHLKLQDAGPVVFAWFSAGYALARELAADAGSRAAISAWVGVDGMHTGEDADGTASDAGVAWLVSLAREALARETVVALGHSDVRTYGSTASTTQVAEEVRRLASMPAGAGPHGGLVLRAYNVRASDHDEHIAALRTWGAELLGEAVALLPPWAATTGPTPSKLPTAAPPAEPTTTAATWPTTPASTPPAVPDRALRRGDRGEAVAELQRRLSAAGYPVRADGLFGSQTEAAVRQLQGDKGLQVDGVVGPRTRGALGWVTDAAAVVRDGTGEAALEVARGYLGQGETPPGSNAGTFVSACFAGCLRDVDRDGDEDKLGLKEGNWCAAFVGRCDSEAGVPRPWRAAVAEICSDARKAGTLRDPRTYRPKPGDLGVHARDGQNPLHGGKGHVYFFESDHGETYASLDGNHGSEVALVDGRRFDDPTLVAWVESPKRA